MTNAEYVKSKLIEMIMELQGEELVAATMDIVIIKKDYAFFLEMQRLFEKEVLPNVKEEELDKMRRNGMYCREMGIWLGREKG